MSLDSKGNNSDAKPAGANGEARPNRRRRPSASAAGRKATEGPAAEARRSDGNGNRPLAAGSKVNGGKPQNQSRSRRSGGKTGANAQPAAQAQTVKKHSGTTGSRQSIPGQARSAPPSNVAMGRQNHRRRAAGSRRADVNAKGQQVRDLPNFSPQFNLSNLKSLGRTGDADESLMQAKDDSVQNALKVIPLGGLCEIGKNMTVYEYGNDMIIVDVGIAFPEEYQPGVDAVIPDFSYVLKNRSKLRGIFLTHGHEDHIGSLPYLLREVSCPVYGGKLTIELVRYKLEDNGLRNQGGLLHVVEPGPKIKAGVFEVEFIHVNHSIADACALAIYSPAGIAVHSGDFKIDYTPIHGEPADLGRLAQLGQQGVLLFVCESTNIERQGFSPSERTVGEAFATQFQRAQGRIIVATFSSNVHRVQQIITAAERYNRKVALVGRSMLNVFRAAISIGYIDMKADTLIDINDVDRYPDNELVIITTGSQGEPMSALTRMAYSEHRNIQIAPGDTVIISATPIPGNEKPIYRVINELYKRRANVVYSAMADIHVSGHAYREEIKLMHQLLKPRFFMPGHGEYRHLYIHAEVAHDMGQPWDSIYILNNGDILEITPKQARIAGYAQAGAVLIDGSPESTIDDEILDQRRSLSDDGVISVSLAVDPRSNQLLGSPTVLTRGFIYEEDVRDLEKDLVKRIHLLVAKANDMGKPLGALLDSRAFREQLQNFLYTRTHRRPVLLLAVIEGKA